jgi:3-methyl-2-oxobutanoate hydroxymethyltransferase
MNKNQITLAKLRQKKLNGEKIVMVTAYDFPGAQLAEAAGVDMILVGDSVGMVVLGHETTVQVTMDDMVHHTRAVTRGCSIPLVVADLPFLSCQITVEEALRNAGRLMQEGYAHAVKLEGGQEVAPTVRRIVQAGIPVVGHLGYTPQSVHQLGVAMQGKSAWAAKQLLDDALALQEAGAFAVVLELVPFEVAQEVTKRLTIPTIGIGSGPFCDGQVQVYHDLLGMAAFTPRHAKHYAEIGEAIRQAFAAYANEVRQGTFPTDANGRHMDAAEFAEFQKLLAKKEED